jgi:putative hydrolases of HD superfamily
LLDDQIVAQEIAQLWQEYEDATTPEALLVKDLDKFEMIVQAMEYEKCWYPMKLWIKS